MYIYKHAETSGSCRSIEVTGTLGSVILGMVALYRRNSGDEEVTRGLGFRDIGGFC